MLNWAITFFVIALIAIIPKTLSECAPPRRSHSPPNRSGICAARDARRTRYTG